jgi:hypothetical protein
VQRTFPHKPRCLCAWTRSATRHAGDASSHVAREEISLHAKCDHFGIGRCRFDVFFRDADHGLGCRSKLEITRIGSTTGAGQLALRYSDTASAGLSSSTANACGPWKPAQPTMPSNRCFGIALRFGTAVVRSDERFGFLLSWRIAPTLSNEHATSKLPIPLAPLSPVDLNWKPWKPSTNPLVDDFRRHTCLATLTWTASASARCRSSRRRAGCRRQ